MSFRRPSPSYALPSLAHDEPLASGEGITRTSSPSAQLFPVRVVFTNGRAMRCTIRAATASQALQFAIARHPAADPNRTRLDAVGVA